MKLTFNNIGIITLGVIAFCAIVVGLYSYNVMYPIF